MDAPPANMDPIMQAVATLQNGDRAGARSALLRLWDEGGSPLQRCTIAHFLADTEEDAAAELEWDLRALEAATGARDQEDRDAVEPALAGFLPSLHLNVGDAYRRMGQHEFAARHADNGIRRSAALGDDGYGDMVKGGLERLRARLAAGGA